MELIYQIVTKPMMMICTDKPETIIPLSILEGKSKEINIKPMTIKIRKRKLKKIRKDLIYQFHKRGLVCR